MKCHSSTKQWFSLIDNESTSYYFKINFNFYAKTKLNYTQNGSSIFKLLFSFSLAIYILKFDKSSSFICLR